MMTLILLLILLLLLLLRRSTGLTLHAWLLLTTRTCLAVILLLLLLRITLHSGLLGTTWLSHLILGNDILTFFNKVIIVRELVMNFRVEHILNDLHSNIALTAQGLYNDFHDLTDHLWEPHEDSRDDLIGNVLQTAVSFVDKFACWRLQVSQLWCD